MPPLLLPILPLLIGLTMTNSINETCTPLKGFANGDGQLAWGIVNDGVMGGRSRGQLEWQGRRLRFFGTLVTAGGGFTSARVPLDAGALEGAASVRVTGLSDERAYEVILRERRPRGQVTWRASLPLPAGQESAVTVDLDAFTPTRFGRRLNLDQMSLGAIDQAGLIIADGRDGDFSLTIVSMSVCR